MSEKALTDKPNPFVDTQKHVQFDTIIADALLRSGMESDPKKRREELDRKIEEGKIKYEQSMHAMRATSIEVGANGLQAHPYEMRTVADTNGQSQGE